MRTQSSVSISANRGFNLIEILVTMLIMAVGLMGIAALQFKGLQYNHDAYSRTQINFLAYDITDRIRLNRAAAATYVAEGAYTAGTAHTACDNTLGADKDNDMNCWYDLIDAALPAGAIADITEPVANSGIYQVSIQWTDRGNSTHTINYSFQP